MNIGQIFDSRKKVEYCVRVFLILLYEKSFCTWICPAFWRISLARRDNCNARTAHPEYAHYGSKAGAMRIAKHYQ